MANLSSKTRKKNTKGFSAAGESQPKKGINFNQQISERVHAALVQYKDDMGLSSDQDVMRLAIASFLVREGYLTNN